MVEAAYDANASSGAAVVFTYTVLDTDEDSNGIWIGDQNHTLKLDANDAIQNAAGDDAFVRHAELGTQSNHRVDGRLIPPSGQVTVSFAQAAYSASEGGTATVTVELDSAAGRQVVIPLTATNQGGATSADYGTLPTSLTFAATDTEQAFTFSAVQDTDNDDDESVLFAFGTLPGGVSEGSTNEAVISITDDDVPSVVASFAQDAYTVAEGGSVTVTVELDAAPERQVIIPLSAANQGGATSADYGTLPTSATFAATDTEKTFTFTATDDTTDDDGESVQFTFGSTLPTGVSEGSTNEATVSITDDDAPASVTVNFAQASYTVAEGGSVAVTVTLDDDPERQVVIPLTRTNEGGASDSDYSGVPANLTFASGDTAKTFTFTANSDTDDDDDERVKIGFGTLPPVATAGSTNEATVSITDDDVPSVVVSFEQASYSVAEGSSVSVKVKLDVAPEQELTIPLTAVNQGGVTSADYGTLPTSVTFAATDTEKTFTFTATDDSTTTTARASSSPSAACPPG